MKTVYPKNPIHGFSEWSNYVREELVNPKNEELVNPKKTTENGAK
tara:strand:+ start:2616 stop:2750 length:135 start_codon:yes stop_codon:yes gene_type:complete